MDKIKEIVAKEKELSTEWVLLDNCPDCKTAIENYRKLLCETDKNRGWCKTFILSEHENNQTSS